MILALSRKESPVRENRFSPLVKFYHEIVEQKLGPINIIERIDGIDVYEVDGDILGRIDYDFIYFDHDTIDISLMRSFVKQAGIGKLLSARLFEKYPHIQSVTGLLIEDNSKVFSQYYVQNQDYGFALKQTPFYKIFSEFGFSEITLSTFQENYQFGDSVQVELRRRL